MRRIFTLGSLPDRKVVVIEVEGSRVRMMRMAPDGRAERTEKDLPDEAEARTVARRMAQELTSRGFVERQESGSSKSRPSKPAKSAPASASARSARPAAEPSIDDVQVDLGSLYDDADDAPAESDGAVVFARTPPSPGPADAAKAKKKKAGGKKKKGGKKKPGGGGDELDKRVLAAVGAVALAGAAFIGYFVYDAFLKPASIVGTWAGSKIDFEIGQPIVHSDYRLVLDAENRASLTLHEQFTSTGTYILDGDILRLKLVDEDDKRGGGGGGDAGAPADEGAMAGADGGGGDEPDEEGDAAAEGNEGPAGEGAGDVAGKVGVPGGGGGRRPDRGSSDELRYRVVLGRATLDLYDPDSNEKVVQLIRFREPPVVAGGPGKAADESKAPADTAVGTAPVDEAADAKLASVEFSPKDGAFKLRHPAGWVVETGSRSDNLYSWARFTKGSARIQVFADAAGSLMSGSDSGGQFEEGSPFAPVQRAHEMYRKTASEEYSGYKESDPALFKGARMGEGRISSFNASGGGLFGSKLRGYHVTLLTGNRRISILCDAPVGEFAKHKPTFLAVCRSLSY